METVKEKQSTLYEILKKERGDLNVFTVPKIVKVVINSGTGSKKDKKFSEIIIDRLAKITGQKPAPRSAKQSIASFKLREGDVVGYSITLRGHRMYNFLDKLINVAIPRMRDFKGLKRTAIDQMGNCTIGIKEHTIFPEAADEDLKDVFGFSIAIVTTAKNKKDAEILLDHIGIPFVKKDTK